MHKGAGVCADSSPLPTSLPPSTPSLLAPSLPPSVPLSFPFLPPPSPSVFPLLAPSLPHPPITTYTLSPYFRPAFFQSSQPPFPSSTGASDLLSLRSTLLPFQTPFPCTWLPVGAREDMGSLISWPGTGEQGHLDSGDPTAPTATPREAGTPGEGTPRETISRDAGTSGVSASSPMFVVVYVTPFLSLFCTANGVMKK